MPSPEASVACLFVPGNHPERFGKAAATGALPILDLEDAVAAADKDRARDCLADAPDVVRQAVVRINARNTDGFDGDLALLGDVMPAAVMLPKAESADDIAALRASLPNRSIIALVETAKGIASARAIAAADGVVRLAFGTVDFCADMRMRDEGGALAAFRSELALASRLAGIASPVDGVCANFSDDVALHEHARRAVTFGFGGVLCIHPRQVSVVEQTFAPSAEDLARARRIVDAAGSASSGVINVDGVMVDRPVVELARQLIALHERLSGAV
ncbi:MAG: CoA ester lyase [Mesorhizobium sp.]